MASALYLHIPFCHSKCHYCSFSSYPGLEELHARYVEALRTELRQIARATGVKEPLSTIFFGGGTPTVLPAEALVDLLVLCRDLFGCREAAEISFEANPGTIDRPKLEQLRQGGFNRLSLGVQSFAGAELAMLGRCHTADEAAQGFAAARAAGFANISLDLMYGLSGQTPQSWRHSLETALALSPEHLSLYQLTVEEGTPFADQLERGLLSLPDEEEVLAMDAVNEQLCAAAGLAIYEISNFSRPGCQCRHNVNYWLNNEYLAAGAGAVSYLDGVRERRVADPQKYCQLMETGGDVITEREQLDLESSFRETVIMGLRMMDGVEREYLRCRFGFDPQEYYGEVLESLIRQQLVELTPTHLRLAPGGRMLANTIMAELV